MKNYSILLAFAMTLLLVSCQPDPPKNFPTLGMNDTLANGHVLDPNLTSEVYLKKIMEMDSMLLIEMKQPNYHSVSGMSGYYADKKRIDSLLRLNVTLPPMFDSSMYSTLAITQFYELSNATKGQTYFLEDSRRIGEKMINVIDKHLEDKTDLVFLIDKTGSMLDDIDKVKKSLASITKRLRTKPDVRLAIAFYGDQQADFNRWFDMMPFTTDFDKADDFVSSIQMTGGGDDPESVFEGCITIMDSLDWRKDANKMILLLGDAGGHEYPPYTIDNVIKKSKEHGILMNYYPVIISPLPTSIDGNVSSYKNTPLINAIFPVPTDGPVNILLNSTTDAQTQTEYSVYDINGREVLSGKSKDDRFVLNLDGEPNGVYIIRVSDAKNKKYEEKKIILSR